MSRPTIKDLADKAGVSVATVNRVLAGTSKVRQATKAGVQRAAEEIGFYGLGTIQSRIAASRPKFRFGVLLLQPHRPFYQLVAQALQAAAASVTVADIDLRIEFLEDISAQNTAARAVELAKDCHAVCITSAVHPVVLHAIERIQSSGVHVFALITQLSATGKVHYIGLDNWKVGRTAAWTFAHVCKAPGKIGILMGNPRYRNQEMNEAGFRSYFREHEPEFALLEPISTFESAAAAQEMTEKLLEDQPDLAGLFISGGGISGALAALRSSGRSGDVVVVGYELMDITRAALLDGTMTLVISHPLQRIAEDTIAGMVSACTSQTDSGNWTRVVPFEIFTRENL